MKKVCRDGGHQRYRVRRDREEEAAEDGVRLLCFRCRGPVDFEGEQGGILKDSVSCSFDSVLHFCCCVPIGVTILYFMYQNLVV